MSSRGVTLVETLLALLLLCGTIFMVVTLFHTALRRSKNVHHTIRAAELAELALSEIRAAAQDADLYSGGMTAYAGTDHTYPEFPGFRVRTEVGPPRTLASPCSGLEGRFAAGRTLDDTVRTIAAKVVWGASDSQSLRVVSQLREPWRGAGEIVLRRVGANTPVASDEIFEYQADLKDGSGRSIPGVSFLWSVRPLTGNAMVLPPLLRNGRTGRFQHRYYHNPTTLDWVSVPGQVRVEARARYMGREISQASPVVELQP